MRKLLPFVLILGFFSLGAASDYVRQTTWATNDLITATKLNADPDETARILGTNANGILTDGNVSATAAIAETKVSFSVSGHSHDNSGSAFIADGQELSHTVSVVWAVGGGDDVDIIFKAINGDSPPPSYKFDASSDEWQVADDGTNYVPMASPFLDTSDVIHPATTGGTVENFAIGGSTSAAPGFWDVGGSGKMTSLELTLDGGGTGFTPVANTLYENNIVKAWLDLNGTGTALILDSFNITGAIADNGTGDYTASINVDFATANNVMVGTADAGGSISVYKAARAADQINFTCRTGNGGAVDPAFASIILIGDQ